MKTWLVTLIIAASAAIASAETKVVDENTIKDLVAKASAGDLDAVETLGNYYLVGFVLKKDVAKAEQVFRVLAAHTKPLATPDNPPALERMGRTLRILASLSKKRGDIDAAKQMSADGLEWTMKAAMHGQAASQVWLSEAYFRGDEVPKDLLEAYAWEIVAARYHTNPQMKAELEQTVINDSERTDPALWAKVVERSEELISQIEAVKK